MVIKLKKTGGFEVSEKQSTVELSDGVVTYGDFHFKEPGEYEADGIGVIFGQNAAMITWQKLQVVYIFNCGTPTKFEEEEFSSADAIMFDEKISCETKPSIMELTDIYDPRVVIYSSRGEVLANLKDTVKVDAVDSVKISATLLPDEGRRDLYSLNG